MKRLLTIAALLLLCATAALAQSGEYKKTKVSGEHYVLNVNSVKVSDVLGEADAPPALPPAQSDEYKKWEFFGGYSEA